MKNRWAATAIPVVMDQRKRYLVEAEWVFRGVLDLDPWILAKAALTNAKEGCSLDEVEGLAKYIDDLTNAHAVQAYGFEPKQDGRYFRLQDVARGDEFMLRSDFSEAWHEFLGKFPPWADTYATQHVNAAYECRRKSYYWVREVVIRLPFDAALVGVTQADNTSALFTIVPYQCSKSHSDHALDLERHLLN